MRSPRGSALLALLAVPAAQAHQGNPNYRSVIDGVVPNTPGVKLQVLNFDDRLQLDNRSGKTVTVQGYQREPYARLLADGTVEVNRNSPAYYLNNDRTSTGTVPANAKPGATPDWKIVDRTGRFQWHDHRIHWMSSITPKQVTDKSKRTKVFDWKVPMQVGAHEGGVDRHAVLAAGSRRRHPDRRARRPRRCSRSLGLGAVVVVRRRRGERRAPRRRRREDGGLVRRALARSRSAALGARRSAAAQRPRHARGHHARRAARP